jgi:hypothetical protein
MSRTTSLSIAVVLAAGVSIFATASSASDKTVPANQSPPTVVGAAVEGSVLAAHHGRWQSDSSVSTGYQWRRCLADGTGCTDVPSATDRIYTPATADVGHTLRVTETATNHDGSAAATSSATRAVTALPSSGPHNTVPPTVAGSPVAGGRLVAANGSWMGAGPIRFSYQWRRCSASGGDCAETSAQSRVYRPSSGDVNRTLRVLVTARGPVGTAAALSIPTVRVAKASSPAPQNRSLPRVQGLPRQGERLAADRGSWANSPGGYSYAWLRCDRSGNGCVAIAGAHGSTYILSTADVGHTIRLQVDARNAGGLSRAFSPPTAIVGPKPTPAAAKPANSVRPSISGTAQEGKTLTGNRGSWTNNPTGYDYSWHRCDRNGDNCDSIGSARGTSYVLRDNDVGKTIRFRVRARNASGSDKASSGPTAVVRAAARPGNTSPPAISGTPAEGATLAGSKGSWTHGPTSYAYVWYRCDRNGNNCAAIGGARSSTYRLTSADVGNTLRLRVTAGNSEGSSSATSVPTAVVQRAPAPPPSRGPGCPAGGNPDEVTTISAPARLLIDTLQADPRVVTRGTAALVVRFHVTSTCGGPVQGALVYATATPYNQFAIPPEAPTGADGWATLVFRRLRGFPVSGRQQLIAVFVRARKPGESVLGGISTRRLVSIPVRLG